MSDAPDKPTALDYATPVAPKKASSDSVIGAGFGIVAGLFGTLMLFYGVGGVVWLVHDWRKVDGQDIFSVAMFILIGAICDFVAFRWIRGAFRQRS